MQCNWNVHPELQWVCSSSRYKQQNIKLKVVFISLENSAAVLWEPGHLQQACPVTGDWLTHSFKTCAMQTIYVVASSSHNQSFDKLLTTHRTTPGFFASSSRDCKLQRRGSSLRLSPLVCSLGGGDVHFWSFWSWGSTSATVAAARRLRPNEMMTGLCQLCVFFSVQDSCVSVSAAAAVKRCANASFTGDAATHDATCVKLAEVKQLNQEGRERYS